MAPSTSIGFIVCSGVLFLLLFGIKNKGLLYGSLITILVVSLFGLLETIGFFLGKELNFEELIFPAKGSINGIAVGIMSPATGLTFFFSAGSIFSLIIGTIWNKTSKFTGLLSGTMGLLALSSAILFTLAYLFERPLLYANPPAIPMAYSTALGFLFLSGSILFFRTGRHATGFLTGDSTRSFLLRLILPLTLFSVLSGFAAGIYSLERQHVNPAFITGLLILVSVIVSGAVAALLAQHLGRSIDRKNESIKLAWQALRESEEKYRNLFETMEQGVVYQNENGEIISANPAAEKILGLTFDQMKGRKSIDPRWKAVDKDKNDLPGEKHPAMIALATHKPVLNFVQGIFNPQKESYVWILINSIPQFAPDSRVPRQVYSTFLDITERQEAAWELEKLKQELENQVAEKTKQLNERIRELEQFYEATINREFRIHELTTRINELEKQSGERRRL